jgi:hypothetical protein
MYVLTAQGQHFNFFKKNLFSSDPSLFLVVLLIQKISMAYGKLRQKIIP